MTVVFTSEQSARQPDAAGTHALIIGVGEYDHLPGGKGLPLDRTMGLQQLSSPPASARAFADWFLGRGTQPGFDNPDAPLATVEMLVSPTATYPSVDGAQVPVEAATRENIQRAYDAWIDRAKTHPASIAVFYFCGHGVMGANDYLLAADFGASRNNPWQNAIDLTVTARAARRHVAGPLYFFLDACRQGKVDALAPGAVPPPLQVEDITRNMLSHNRFKLWATGEGMSAFGAAGSVSRFTSALIEALSGYRGDALPGQAAWIVTGEGIASSVRSILEEGNRKLPPDKAQFVEQSMIGSQPFHRLIRRPRTVSLLVSASKVDPDLRERLASTDAARSLPANIFELFIERSEEDPASSNRNLEREIADWARRYRDLEQQLEDESAAPLAEEARTLLAAGRLSEAGNALDRLILERETRVAKESERLASAHFGRAQVYSLENKPLLALPHYGNAYRYQPDSVQYGFFHGTALLMQYQYALAEPVLMATLRNARSGNAAADESLLPKTLNALATLYGDTRRFAQAVALHEEALPIFRALAAGNSDYLPLVGESLINKAVALTKMGIPDKANATYLEAMAVFEQLELGRPDAYREQMGIVLHNYGSFLLENGRAPGAVIAYGRALAIRRVLAKQHPALRPAVANTLRNLGAALRVSRKYEDAEAAFLEGLAIARDVARDNPKRHLALVAGTLTNLGNLYSGDRSNAQRLKAAENAFVEAVGIFRDLDSENSPAYRQDLVKALGTTGVLYDAMKQPAKAESAMVEALDMARELARENGLAFAPLAATIAENLGHAYLHANNVSDALDAYREALDGRRWLAKRNPNANPEDRATLLEQLSRIYAATGQPGLAADAEREARDLRKRAVR